MGIFDRMGRAFSSNFNALLDRAEDPGKSIDLTLREMEAQVRAAHREVVRAVAAEKQLRKKGDELAAEVERWDERAELAVRHGDDELAREAIRQKRRAAAERERVERLRVEQRGNALELKTEVERMEQKLEELKAKRGLLVARTRQIKAGGGVEDLGAPAARPGAFVEFRRMEEQLDGVEATFEAQREVEAALGGRSPGGLTPQEVEARFRKLEHGGAEAASDGRGEDVDDELRALKRKIRIRE